MSRGEIFLTCTVIPISSAILDDSWPGSAQRLAAGESMKHALHDATTVWNRREYLESLLQVLHGIPFQQKTAISGAHLDLTSNIPKGKQCSDILRQDDVQEVSSQLRWL